VAIFFHELLTYYIEKAFHIEKNGVYALKVCMERIYKKSYESGTELHIHDSAK
jgi:hypothetical protein